MTAVNEWVRGERGGRWLVVAAACAVALAWSAATASAATVGTIPGSPLTINADDNGQLQVTFKGSSTGEFFPPSSQSANAGLNVAVAQAEAVYGFEGSAFTSLAVPTLAGDGSAGNPWVLSTNYATDTPGTNFATVVNEKVTYVNGTTDVGLQYSLSYQGDNPGPVGVRAYEAADLYVSGSDVGAGFFAPGPPRQVGGINEAQGSSGRLVEQTPWSHYQEGRYSDVFSVVGAAGTFNDTIDSTLLDNGVGAQWDGITLAAGSPQTLQTTWRFRRFTPLQLTLAAAAKSQGQIATATVTARNSDGDADPGRSVLYTISGPNFGGGTATTGADGTATISWLGANAGTDTLTAFIDANGNGSRDADEPAQSVTVVWGAPPPPVPGKSVVAKVVSGSVLVKYPPGYIPRAGAPRAAAGFVPFKGAANIPVGSQLDTSRGRVALTSAADTAGAKTQTSDFYDGVFQVRQAVPKKKPRKPTALITDVVMKGQIARSQCAPLKGARSAAVDAARKKKGPKSVLGKLWGSGKGKFRTDGRYSSATVRGTIWLVQDECDGTLTRVRRGVVSVRDLKRKKTITVKAGHSYLASAVTSKSRRKKK
jgi:hypothetical protein